MPDQPTSNTPNSKTEKSNKPNRRQQILEVLAQMLEKNPGERITTAKLAKEVGVTEAALYRHFPSKGKMFEGLLEFIEESVFTRIKLITQEVPGSIERLQRIVIFILAFAEKNPGMCSLLVGGALAGEKPKIRQRSAQFFDRLETQLRQIIREAEIREQKRPRLTGSSAASLLTLNIEGRIHQYVRSEFKRSPTQGWSAHWPMLASSLFQSD
ncbi:MULTISPECIES: nucleoid occlusion factor SlmA [unclassified Oleiphilus]|jgi:TetR/AcrR family transcriptional regulator|uniref:nucleoid occlusion factor SlmA n=1 Tax=unclassified Oleiphilus TaxID=2631174 RepID=UPI0007C20661|nr:MULTISPECIES: nucleoid occlusion factor SlmA [unclassified Oleiphilus]KZY44153.1 nucleoid occlusion factor SlmA [Oleiphilus sp. HI0050]KZY76218.1 nucleoid occlusion factor SlmA [Oleiphilus sp. HI0068]KZY78892.1 nucleoid occlusion factor SlmA [Oleiphilus sp. HI0069]KZY89350.1 nucleoid occlusion factor SlmA [Oleiphilus sp. HI0072]KZZ14727.1 nucleoid occlusion factor SlmA [Oleiphilus sp. HI0078]KZZ19187.1 nucleoid occlusion factor SlmA [Oleiphilus sp. HI0081]KZZ32429.1 nucleoid occlusion fac